MKTPDTYSPEGSNLVICTISHDADRWDIFLALNGLTVITPYSSSAKSWNHETAQFDHVHFDDQVFPYLSTHRIGNSLHVGPTNRPSHFQVPNVSSG